MSNIFSQVAARKPQTNVFNLSNDHKLTTDMGRLVPVYVADTVPGDVFSLRAEAMLRFAPLMAPVMHRIDVTMHWFFVPNRILWPNWENFITNKITNLSPPVLPLSGNTVLESSLGDYLGIPPRAYEATTGINVSAFPYAAYQRIYNEYYRDQNLVTEVPGTVLNDGSNNANWGNLAALRRRAWQHDYFTSALPWPQKGAEALVPMGNLSGFAPVQVARATPTGTTAFTSSPTGAYADNGENPFSGSPDGRLYVDANDSESTMTIGATSINDLRRALKLQEWLEKTARGGSRYIEHILSHFGVRSSDRRLDRPEFIGGSKAPVVISEVLQTSDSTSEDSTPQGNMAGHGISVDSGKTVSYRTEEHGWIMCIMSIMPKTAYQQGINRMFTRQSAFDYYWPSFAHLGEQPIQNQELYVMPTQAANATTFGYTPRYAEYKYMPNRVSGSFRSSLAFWHLGRIFSAQPGLNGSFVTADPSKRIFAVTEANVDSIYAHVFTHVKARRPMPIFGTPTL